MAAGGNKVFDLMPLTVGEESTKQYYTDLKKRQMDAVNKDIDKIEVKKLQEWLQHQPHLPKISDAQLVMFLHSCHFSIELTKKTIDQYFTVKRHAPEIFQKRNVKDDMLHGFSVIEVGVVPDEHRTHDNCRPFFMKFKDTDSSKFNFLKCMRAGLCLLDLFVGEGIPVKGAVAVFDAKGLGLGHLAKMNISLIKQILIYIQEALPIPLESVHVLNTNSVVQQLMNLSKPFIKPELYRMLHFYTPSELNKFIENHVHKDCLPSDYGGNLKSIHDLHVASVARLTATAEWLENVSTFLADETKRPGKIKTSSEIFGMEGSFKSLAID